MVRRKQNRTARKRSKRQPAPPPVQHKPEIRSTFYTERQPGKLGAYEIRVSLAEASGGGQDLVAHVRTPQGNAVEIARRFIDNDGPPLVADAAQSYGPPGGLDPQLLQDLLWECRIWTQRDNAAIE